MKLVHAADLHLDSPMRGLRRYPGAPEAEVRGATRRALENLVELCLAERAELLLLAGDLFDGDWRDYATGLFFAAQLARLKEGGVRVVLVRGNHDAASHVTRHLTWPDHVTALSTRAPETVRFEELGVAVHGQGFARRVVDTDLAAAYPDAEPGLLNVGLLHTALDGREGHDPYAPTRVDVLASKGYDYWALGHVHAREVVSRDPWIVFPGNLQGRHARETGAKGATLVTVEDGRIAAVEHRALDVVRWAAVDVDARGCADPDEALERARSRLADAAEAADGRLVAARVTLAGRSAAHAALVRDRERWESEVRAAAVDLAEPVWVERVVFATDPVLDLDALRERDDPVGRLFRALEGLRADDAALVELGAELAELEAKLPREARTGPDGLRLDDPGVLRAALLDVERALLPRLFAAEER